MGNNLRAVLGCAFLLFSVTALTWSQSVDTALLGTVTDSAGGAVAAADVTVIQTATGVTHSAKTSSSGNYEVRYLLPGAYSIEVHAPGFNTDRRSAIDLQIGQQAKVDFSLQLGSVQQTVEVHSAQPLLQTENASLAGVVGQERIENLPLNGRKFNDLALLTPGVRVSNPDLHTSSTAGSTIAGNGGRIVWGQVNVDGTTMVNNRHAYVNIFPSVDAIQEFKVQTGNYSAEYGGNAGTNVNIQIKSGSNQFHGDQFEFFRNQDLDARNYFRPAPLPKNILKQNQFGATLGGPIVHDKTFFFGSYEGIRSIQESPGTAVVLTAAQRMGIFSSTVTDPNTGLPFANNRIPTSRLNPVSQSLINQYTPLPNASGSTNYAGASLGDLTVHQEIARVDHYFSARDSLFVHYIRADRNFPDRDLNPFFNFTGKYPATNIFAQYIHTFTPALVNEFRAGVNRENVSQLSVRTNTSFTIESLGINGLKVGGPNGRPLRSSEEGFPLINISGYLGMGDDKAASNLDDSQTYQLVDNVSYVKGRHTLKAGADVRKLYDNATTNNTPFGSLSFTSDISGDAAAAYMLGFPRTTLTPEGVPITKARQWRIGAYAQDDWKLTPKLTINVGLRYDLFDPPKDVNAVTRTLDFSQNPPAFVPAPGQILNNLWHVSYKDLSPRVGFAWNPVSTWVVRGGYGFFYYGGQFDHLNILQLNPPTAGSLTITNPSLNPIATIQNPVPAALYPANPFFNAVSLPADRNHPDLYVQDWNLTVSKQFGNNVLDVGYVGNKGTHLDTSFQNYNQPPPGPGVIQPRRPYPTFARIRLEDYGANSNYNSVQIHFERRLSKGLSLTLAYAWSHEIDTTANEVNGGGCGCQDPRHRNEPASGLIDQRHNLVIGYVWKLPIAQQAKGIVAAVAAGWSLEGLISIASGNPFDINESSDTQNNDGIWERPNLTGQSLSVANPNPARWFNTNAFAASILMYGNTPRNAVIGPGTDTLNLSLAKEFRMFSSEIQRLQFRAESFNALNTPQFSNPDAKLGDGIFGQITSTKSDNRVLQFALKYLF